MVLAQGNDVLLCRDGLGEAGLVAYSMGLARKQGLDTAPLAFQLMKRADVDKLEVIRCDGIKHLSMNAVAHQASVDHVERTHIRQRVVGSVLDECKVILGIAPDDTQADAENIKVEVLLSFDRRGGTIIDQQQLTELAQLTVIDEDEGFFIEILNGSAVEGLSPHCLGLLSVTERSGLPPIIFSGKIHVRKVHCTR